MTEDDIKNALAPLVSGRFYPDVAPLNAGLPLITFQQVGGSAVNYLGAASSDKKNARIQINVWSSTRLQAMQLIRQVENEMVKDPVLARVEGAAIARYDSETKQYGAIQDFSVWVSS